MPQTKALDKMSLCFCCFAQIVRFWTRFTVLGNGMTAVGM